MARGGECREDLHFQPDWSLLRPDKEQPLGLVLSGGGARGAFQVGVWEVLYEDPRGLGRLPDVVSGTSAGSINAFLLAAGLSPQQMLRFWLDLSEDPPVVANDSFFRSFFDGVVGALTHEPFRGVQRRIRSWRLFKKILSKHRWYRQSGLLSFLLEYLLTARFGTLSHLLGTIKTVSLFQTDQLRERLAQTIGGTHLQKTAVRLAINAVDVRTGQVVRFVNHQVPAWRRGERYQYESAISVGMVQASAAIPLLFHPVTVGARTLWDGGLLVNTPLAPAVALGARRILPILVTLCKNARRPLGDNFGSALEHLADAFLENAYNIDRKLLLERNELSQLMPELGFRETMLFRAIRPCVAQVFDIGSYLYFEPNAMQAMYEAGKQAALDWLDHGLQPDRRDFEE